jgi:rhamnogalacturonyl hydrolase YesR
MKLQLRHEKIDSLKVDGGRSAIQTFRAHHMKLPAVVVLLLLATCAVEPDTRTPLEVVQSIADKVIRETTFEFERVPMKPVLGIEFVDFRRLFGTEGPGSGYAFSSLESTRDTVITFGISASDAVKVWVNQGLAYSWNRAREPVIKEFAYRMFSFNDTFQVSLRAGSNPILVKVAVESQPWIFFLRPINEHGEEESTASFSLASIVPDVADSRWVCRGPFPVPQDDLYLGLDQVYPIEKAYLADELQDEAISRFPWIIPQPDFLQQLTSRYEHWAYHDWHYSHGATMLAFLALTDATSESRYIEFARKYCDFVISHYNHFLWQYETLHAFRGSYHRFSRRTMLDDTGAPALPFVELFLREKTESYRDIVFPVGDYIRNDQVRLPDDTFCRPEPVAYTIWADDLFMSVPYLLRMAQVTGDPAYYDDAAHQAIKFAERLFVAEQGLFKHAWFSVSGERSIAFWGRANGWIVWAMTELLTHLPENHRAYLDVLNIFRQHMAGLAAHQDPNTGMWHQVLDHPQSYEETSCTSMYVLGMARGVRLGWLDESYRERALKGWAAITRKVDKHGTVRGICCGTGVGDNLDFYFKRPTYDNDPRGLGQTITAGVEIDKLVNAMDQ